MSSEKDLVVRISELKFWSPHLCISLLQQLFKQRDCINVTWWSVKWFSKAPCDFIPSTKIKKNKKHFKKQERFKTWRWFRCEMLSQRINTEKFPFSILFIRMSLVLVVPELSWNDHAVFSYSRQNTCLYVFDSFCSNIIKI